MFTFTPESDADWWEVEALFDLCFAPGRNALSSYRLRDGVAPLRDFSLVARDPGDIAAGAIRYWPVRIETTQTETGTRDPARALLLGPVAVHPTHQGEGLGRMLIRESLDLARASGWGRVMLVGDAPYYGRFGFNRLPDIEMPPPTNPDRVLGLALSPGAWDDLHGKVTRDA